MSEHLERGKSTSPEDLVIGHNSSNLPESSSRRIRKPTPLFLTCLSHPSAAMRFWEECRCPALTAAVLLLTVSCWQGLKRQSSDWGRGQERAVCYVSWLYSLDLVENVEKSFLPLSNSRTTHCYTWLCSVAHLPHLQQHTA